MPEYYLTDSELEIFQTQKAKIYQAFSAHSSSFELVELGAGDGLKTKILLSYFLSQEAKFEYAPIDISQTAVEQLISDLKTSHPQIQTRGLIGDYFLLLEQLNNHEDQNKIILFLGSNIGNFKDNEALKFLAQIKKGMKDKDQLFIGFDLKKEPQLILDAYSDPHGYTAAFNLNLLTRINRELDANFELSGFKHFESYDTHSGAAKSFLISQKKQEVYLSQLDSKILFEKGEKIFMEISQKYDEQMISELAQKSGFEIIKNFYDSSKYYMNSLWQLSTNKI